MDTSTKHNGGWSGTFRRLSISQESQPELHMELARLGQKERAERARSLMLLGLMVARGNYSESIPTGSVLGKTTEEEEASPGINKSRTGLRDVLLGSNVMQEEAE